MKVHTYLRVSTSSQDLEPQRLELARYCEFRKWEIVKEYTDVISGAKSSRTGLDALMNDIRKGRVKTLMAVKIDRLARSMTHFAQIVGELKGLGVALVIPGQGIDTTTSNPAGVLTMNILASIAEFEREIIRERTNAGLQVAREKGVVLGRPKGSQLGVTPQECVILREQGLSFRKIAEQLEISEPSVRRLIKAA